MSIYPIKTSNAPSPIAPYSQAMRAGDFLFISGQGPIDPQTGKAVVGDIKVQVARTMENLLAILAEAGGSISSIAKVNIYLRNINDFREASNVYGTYFDGPPPARTCIQAGELPGQIDVEIEAIAYLPNQNREN